MTEVFTPARRGDLAVIEPTTGEWVRIGVVTSVSREGVARRVRWVDEAADAPETALTFRRRTLLVPARRIRMQDALAAARSGGPVSTLCEAYNLLAPFEIGA